jgi:hypothetical protein
MVFHVFVCIADELISWDWGILKSLPANFLSEHAQWSCPSCKMAASYGAGGQSPPVIGRPVDRVFEDAQFTGEVNLSGRKLKDYPKICTKYDLADTIHAGKFCKRLVFVVKMIQIQNWMLSRCSVFIPASPLCVGQ